MEEKDKKINHECNCGHEHNHEVKFETENDLNIVVIKDNKDLLINEDCCTCINIMLKNDGQILTSFLGSHNPYIIKQLEQAQKYYFKELKKALKAQTLDEEYTNGCAHDCHCEEDCDCHHDHSCGCNDNCDCGEDCNCNETHKCNDNCTCNSKKDDKKEKPEKKQSKKQNKK